MLVRNVEEYYELYNDEVMLFLNDTGFNKLYSPIQIEQDGC